MEEGGRGAAPGLAVVLEGAAAGMAPGGSAAGLPPPAPPLGVRPGLSQRCGPRGPVAASVRSGADARRPFC